MTQHRIFATRILESVAGCKFDEEGVYTYDPSFELDKVWAPLQTASCIPDPNDDAGPEEAERICWCANCSDLE